MSDSLNVFISGFPKNYTESELTALATPYGEIVNTKVLRGAQRDASSCLFVAAVQSIFRPVRGLSPPHYAPSGVLNLLWCAWRIRRLWYPCSARLPCLNSQRLAVRRCRGKFARHGLCPLREPQRWRSSNYGSAWKGAWRVCLPRAGCATACESICARRRACPFSWNIPHALRPAVRVQIIPVTEPTRAYYLEHLGEDPPGAYP